MDLVFSLESIPIILKRCINQGVLYMKRIIILMSFSILVIISLLRSSLHGQSKWEPADDVSFTNVKKINDNVYTGKVADDFYLAMERITKNNINNWLHYASYQDSSAGRMDLHYLKNLDGINHFKTVLNEYFQGIIKPINELWVVYASNQPITGEAHLEYYAENPHIEMFVSVITSPEAIFTSHMGISRTWEAALDLQRYPLKRKKHRNQSLYLHSFAAKVMKFLDSKKIYMLTAPNNVMRTILIKNMPSNTVFVGDSIYKKELEAIEKDPLLLLDESDLEMIQEEGPDQREQLLKESIENESNFLRIKEKLSLLKSNPPRIIRVKNGRKQQFTILGSDGKPLVTFDQSTLIYQWMFTNPYLDKGLHLPYVLVDLNALATVTTLINL